MGFHSVPDDASIPPVDPLIGTRVGEYEILEAVGEGGMGVVYRGIQPVIKKRVAIKVLKPQVAGDEQQVRRLVIEAESVNAIGHRGIIDIFGLGTLPDGRPYVIMEFLEGEPLDQWIARQPGGRVALLTTLELLLEICAPLGAAHRANVIHRDLKPSNVFVCTQADGTRFLKLLDFGLAKRAVGLDGNTKQTSQSTVSGTPDYMAPEQARGLDISPRSDLYALGIIAFELLTGRVPFTGATPMDVMVAHVGQAAPDPRTLEPSIPEAVVALVMRLLSKSPDERPQTVDEVRSALEDIVVLLGNPRPRSSREFPALVPQGAPAPIQLDTPAQAMRSAPPPPAQKKTQRAMLLGAVAGLAILSLGGVVVMTRTAPEAPEPTPAPVPVPAAAAQVAPVVEPQVAMVDPPEPLQVDAGGAVVAVLTPAKEEAVAPSPQPRVKVAAPPTNKQLKERVARLNERAKAKADLDPTALQFLGRYSIEATAADSPARRAKLDRALSDWERNFLRR